MKNIVVFDIDGVLADYEGMLVQKLASRYGKSAYGRRDKYDFRERYDDDDVFADAEHIRNDKYVYGVLNPDMAAVGFAEQLLENGFQLMFMTARPRSADVQTERWLERHIKGYKDTLGCQFSLNKAATIAPYKDDVFFVVEDNPAEIEDLQKIGVPAFAWEQPWNQGVFPRLIWSAFDKEVMVQSSQEEEWTPFFQGVTA